MRELIVNKQDLQFNINKIKSSVPNNDYTIIAVVKGNGYGLDIVKYTKFLEENGINFFAVASVEEAVKLRSAGVEKKIICLTPCVDELDVKLLITNNIILTIDSEKSASVASKTANSLNKEIQAHLKIDTGLSRYGFSYKTFDEIKKVYKEHTNIKFEGIFSHLSNSLAKDKSFSELQFKRFMNIIDNFKNEEIDFKYKHICNSSGFFKYPEMRLNTARIGSAFIGNAYGDGNFLNKIGTFHTKVERVRQVEPGEIIGYGNSYIAKRPTKIAILHTGYYDGIGIALENQRFKKLSKIKRAVNDIKNIFRDDSICLKINNTSYRVIGQIGMFDTVIDITNKELNENDDVYFHVHPVFIESSIERKYI